MPRVKVEYRSTSKTTFERFKREHPEIKITFSKWAEIIRSFNEAFRDYILDTGDKVKMPYGFGEFAVSKKQIKRFHTLPSGEEKIVLPVNWKKTRELGKMVYHFNDHTEGYRFRWFWFKDKLRFKGSRYFIFKPSRLTSRKITEYLNKSPYYQHLYKEWSG